MTLDGALLDIAGCIVWELIRKLVETMIMSKHLILQKDFIEELETTEPE